MNYDELNLIELNGLVGAHPKGKYPLKVLLTNMINEEKIHVQKYIPIHSRRRDHDMPS